MIRLNNKMPDQRREKTTVYMRQQILDDTNANYACIGQRILSLAQKLLLRKCLHSPCHWWTFSKHCMCCFFACHRWNCLKEFSGIEVEQRGYVLSSSNLNSPGWSLEVASLIYFLKKKKKKRELLLIEYWKSHISISHVCYGIESCSGEKKRKGKSTC